MTVQNKLSKIYQSLIKPFYKDTGHSFLVLSISSVGLSIGIFHSFWGHVKLIALEKIDFEIGKSFAIDSDKMIYLLKLMLAKLRKKEAKLPRDLLVVISSFYLKPIIVELDYQRQGQAISQSEIDNYQAKASFLALKKAFSYEYFSDVINEFELSTINYKKELYLLNQQYLENPLGREVRNIKIFGLRLIWPEYYHQNMVNVAKQLGLKIREISPTLAVFPYKKLGDNFCIINIDKNNTDIFVILRGVCVYNSEFLVGAQDFQTKKVDEKEHLAEITTIYKIGLAELLKEIVLKYDLSGQFYFTGFGVDDDEIYQHIKTVFEELISKFSFDKLVSYRKLRIDDYHNVKNFSGEILNCGDLIMLGLAKNYDDQ